jgi:hypothetical protein
MISSNIGEVSESAWLQHQETREALAGTQHRGSDPTSSRVWAARLAHIHSQDSALPCPALPALSCQTLNSTLNPKQVASIFLTAILGLPEGLMCSVGLPFSVNLCALPPPSLHIPTPTGRVHLPDCHPGSSLTRNAVGHLLIRCFPCPVLPAFSLPFSPNRSRLSS